MNTTTGANTLAAATNPPSMNSEDSFRISHINRNFAFSPR
jgi:hypothetical protein